MLLILNKILRARQKYFSSSKNNCAEKCEERHFSCCNDYLLLCIKEAKAHLLLKTKRIQKNTLYKQ